MPNTSQSGGQLVGMKELDKTLNDLIKAAEPDKVEPLLTKAGEMLVEKAKPITPFDPKRTKGHHLREALVTKLMPRRRNNVAAPAIFAVDHKIAPHASLVEFGHGGPHPAPAHPYFRPTWDANKEKAANIIIEGLSDNIDKAIK